MTRPLDLHPDRRGRDKGADIPMRTDYVVALKPLLDRFGTSADLSIIPFTLDESVYARELALLAGHHLCLKLGPARWFHDSPDGMRRFRKAATGGLLRRAYRIDPHKTAAKAA